MRSPIIKQKSIQLTCPNLPLGVYREVAAHLRQVDGVQTNLLIRPTDHDDSQKFDYYQSQVAALQIECETDIAEDFPKQVESILDYYAQRYGDWLDYSSIKED